METKPKSKRKYMFLALGTLGLLITTASIYQSIKPIPPGISQAFPLRSADDLKFFADYTYLNTEGERHSEQSIFNEVLRLVNQAQKSILIDMFLFNDFQGAQPEYTRQIANELTEALIARKKAHPNLQIMFISDPLNTFYGGSSSTQLKALEQAGAQVVLTDLRKLRASNPSWSGLWHLGFQWFGNSQQKGWLPNIVGPGKVTFRSYLALLNFKANHRKTIVVDEGDSWTGLVSSANPHDGSSAHSNVALRFRGEAVLDLIRSELAVARLSGIEPLIQIPQIPQPLKPSDASQIQVLTEGKFPKALLNTIHNAQAGDEIRMAIFYFSYRPLIQSLKAAHQRGVKIRVLMDPNKDAFGRQKNGIPNRQTAMELSKTGIPIRWCDTHGEQCHSKLTLVTGPHRDSELFLGSANYTRRNLDDLNLETTVHLLANADSLTIKAATGYYENSWSNTPTRIYSTDYTAYSDHSATKYWQYRLMEWTGWSTF